MASTESRANDALLAAALLMVDPRGLGGVRLQAQAGPVRDAWLQLLRSLMPPGMPLQRLPQHASDDRLLGGIDLPATLAAGRPVLQQGLLATADGGLVLAAMAERLAPSTAAYLSAALDQGQVRVERDGITALTPSRVAVVALDEALPDDSPLSPALADRLALWLDLASFSLRDAPQLDAELCATVQLARLAVADVRVNDEIIEALCAATLALGVASPRAAWFAVRVARASAALFGRAEAGADDAALAARLVLAPRATQVPAAQPDAADNDQPDIAEDDMATEPPPASTARDQDPSDERPPELPGDAQPDVETPDPDVSETLAETVLEAARAAIPPGLLAALKIGEAARARARAAGRSGAVQKNQARGRPLGARRGEPRAGARLNVIETLRAAAPWQRLRQREQAGRALRFQDAPVMAQTSPAKPADGVVRHQRIYVRREDFHVTRFRQLGQTTTVFVVDASGSSAMNRLAEAKGAVELLLADCYVRRDRVAVLAFRGKGAELLLPPTRSLARAKRSLAGLPGGGATPLAAAIDAARELADQISRHGQTPVVVLLTDGRGNVARDGATGRARAGEDAMAAARQMRLGGFTALLLDTSPQPQPVARRLAQEMGATYLPLPYAGAQLLSQAVRAASGAGAA